MDNHFEKIHSTYLCFYICLLSFYDLILFQIRENCFLLIFQGEFFQFFLYILYL